MARTSMPRIAGGWMTIPIERTWAVKRTYEFLRDLCDKSKTPRIPLEIRKRAQSLIKHYPTDFYLEQSQKKCPDVWGEIKKNNERN